MFISSCRYIKSELFKTGTAPTTYSTSWKLVEIDPESGKLASPYCPQRVQKAYLKRPANKTISTKVKDYALYEPVNTCPLHSTATGDTVTVTVCTDPAHNGQYYLANVAGSNQQGGCPSQYVETKTFGSQYAPNQYCTIEGHQVTGKNNTNPDNNNTNTTPNNNQDGNDNTATLRAPVDVSAKVNNDKNGVIISWTDNYNEPTTLYQIEKTDNATGKKTILKTYFKSITDGSISSGSSYSYRVKAINEEEETSSNWTGAVSITLP